jgi:hypothetical protein
VVNSALFLRRKPRGTKEAVDGNATVRFGGFWGTCKRRAARRRTIIMLPKGRRNSVREPSSNDGLSYRQNRRQQGTEEWGLRILGGDGILERRREEGCLIPRPADAALLVEGLPRRFIRREGRLRFGDHV